MFSAQLKRWICQSVKDIYAHDVETGILLLEKSFALVSPVAAIRDCQKPLGLVLEDLQNAPSLDAIRQCMPTFCNIGEFWNNLMYALYPDKAKEAPQDARSLAAMLNIVPAAADSVSFPYKQQFDLVFSGQNAQYEDLSQKEIFELISACLALYLHTAISLQSQIEEAYDKAKNEDGFNAKQYCLDIISRYGKLEQDGFRYVDIAWKSSLAQSVDFSTVDSIMDDPNPLVKILGEAGCGKTTVLKQIEYLLAKRFCAGESDLFPVLISLDGVRLGTSVHISIEDVICSHLHITKDILKSMQRRNMIYLLLDGFSKILDLNIRKQIAYSIDSMSRKFPKQKILLTDRSLMRPAINTMAAAMVYRRYPMDGAMKKNFIAANCLDADANALLLSYFTKNPAYFENFNTPARLKQLIELVSDHKVIPANFDGEYIHFLFTRTLNSRRDENSDYLEDFACALSIANDTGMPEKAAYACLARCKQILGYTIPDSRKCLNLLIEIGILHNNDGIIDFCHPAYRNYFLMIAFRNDLVNILGNHQ